MTTPMSDNRIAGSRRGQTLVIAIMVMFILAVIAAIFIALVSRNLFRSERFSNVDVVAQIAEAGVRYADTMLTSSEEGADWRPVPDNLGIVVGPGNVPPAGEPTPVTGWTDMRDQHPDFRWVRAYWPTELPAGAPEGMGYAGPTGGFTTVNSGQGRFLLRVSYNPSPKDPFSKYIKIESIGRWGTIDNNDPTTLRPYAQSNLRREITAYKPIGVTDYLRFITNKGNRSMDFGLGCPGFNVKLGRANAGTSTNWLRGGPIRVNGNLMWYGDQSINLYLRGIHPVDGGGSPTSDLVPIDTVEVTGEIKVADPNLDVTLTRLNTDGSQIDTVNLRPSDDSDFTTAAGFYRDGSDLTDNSNAARGVKRIDPPLVDQLEPTNSTSRYLLLTLNSGERVRAGGRWLNLGEHGWGRGIYIGNTRDTQNESDTLIGGYTLRADWMKPNSGLSSYWKGPFYIPNGCLIVLHPNDTDGDGLADLTITRTDILSNGQKYVWRDAWGDVRRDWGGTATMPYPDPTNGRRIYKRNRDGSFNRAVYKDLDGNGVIYAAGNVRIRGMLPPGMQLTVVSNENIYIEGNLLKNRPPGWTPGSGSPDPYGGADSTCGLALLARENICVNTTQFFSPLNSIRDGNAKGAPQNAVLVRNEPDSWLKCAFDFGPWESESGASAPTEWWLYLRAAAEYSSPSYINAWLNPAPPPLIDWGVLYLNNKTFDLPKHVWGVGDPRFNQPGWGIGSVFTGDAFPLTAALNADQLTTTPGSMNLLQIGLDQTTYTRENCWVGRPAVQPMDIRIEAILYAQEGSFFVIPGHWFNLDPSDVPNANGVRPPGVHPRFPYFGQPLDVRVIIDGAVSENVPAAMSDVEEWMSKWGRIPAYYGSTTVPTAHPNEGLTILYDDHVAWPYANLNPAPANAIRRDKFGRTLPIAPKLPVSGSLIYFGDVM